MDCFYRANIGAGTAIGTNFSVNHIDITLRNRFYRAFIDAAATSSAIIINYISHIIRFLVKQSVLGATNLSAFFDFKNKYAGIQII
jgi:hypothetical protein